MMNDIQLALLGFGGGAIAFMVAYNWWQERRHPPRHHRGVDSIDASLPSSAVNAQGSSFDAAMRSSPAGERQDPKLGPIDPSVFEHAVSGPLQQARRRGLGVGSNTESKAEADAMTALGGSQFSTGSTSQGEQSARTTSRPEASADGRRQPSPPPQGVAPLISDRLHALVFVKFDRPVPAESVNDVVNQMRRSITKPIRVAALPFVLSEHGSEQWLLPAPGLAIRALRFAVQLANRKGPLTSVEYSEFIQRIQHFADRYDGEVDFADMAVVVARADRLDHQAAGLDTLLGLHCVLADTVELRALQEHLEQAGWSSVGRHWWLAEGDQPLASVVIHEAPAKRVLSFSLDVPNAQDPLRALEAIATLGGRMANLFGGALMDDAGSVVTASALVAIRQQLQLRARSLAEAGFAPGSHQARMLFG